MSYNSRGFASDRREYIKVLLSKCSILFLQEHWLSDGQLPLLGNLDSNFVYTGVCGLRLTISDFRLLFVNIYLPYEGGAVMTGEFVDQLVILENIIATNVECPTVILFMMCNDLMCT